MLFERNGVGMYYEVHGQGGRALLLLHGWGGSCDSFLPVIRDFSGSRAVWALDFPGHRNSAEPPEAWSVTEYAVFVREFMLEMKLDRCDIVAHSFGGRVALYLASHWPEICRKLVLTGCAGIPPKKDGKLTGKTRLYKALRSVAGSAAARAVLGEERVEGLREGLVQQFGSSDYKALTPSMRATFNRVIAQDLTDCLPLIQAPTVLFWGDQDTATPLWMGQLMEKTIPDAGLIVMPGCGHFAYLDRYADFCAVLKRFLNDENGGNP